MIKSVGGCTRDYKENSSSTRVIKEEDEDEDEEDY